MSGQGRETEIKFPLDKGNLFGIFLHRQSSSSFLIFVQKQHTHKFAHSGLALGRYDRERIRWIDEDAEIIGLTLQDRPPNQIVGHRPDHTFLKLWCPEPSLKSPRETHVTRHQSIIILCLTLYLCVTRSSHKEERVFAKNKPQQCRFNQKGKKIKNKVRLINRWYDRRQIKSASRYSSCEDHQWITAS